MPPRLTQLGLYVVMVSRWIFHLRWNVAMAQRHDVGCLCKPRLLLPVLSPHDRQSRLDHVSRMLLLTGMCCSTCSACNLTPTTTSASRATPSAAMVSAHHGCCAWAASRGGSTAWSGVRGGGLGVLDSPAFEGDTRSCSHRLSPASSVGLGVRGRCCVDVFQRRAV